MNLHFQNRKQITINNLFNEPATVAADASLGLQFADPSLILVIMEMSLQNGMCYMWYNTYIRMYAQCVENDLQSMYITCMCTYFTVTVVYC